MNILIPYSWLKEYLQTDLSPKDFASMISAHGPSIERWHQTEDGDVVFDVEITTNRIDAYSIFGMAREANTILQYNEKKSKLLEPDLPEIINGSGVNHELYTDVDEELCPRFTAVVIDGVCIEKSPKFMTERLEKVGVRSLNNVVDVTNYVMWELGQPMHVFDYDKIVGHKMILRKASAGEKLETLDGVVRTIPEGSIIIEDGSGKLIDLAGVMGGENSAVDENTRRVLLFAQTYNPHVIRKTTMIMAHRTEAASRFEKGLDPEQVMPALQRATALLLEHAGGTVASDVIDIYPKPYQSREVQVSLNTLAIAIGTPIASDQVQSILELLGFETDAEDEVITARVPSFRANDIETPEDLVEEVARMYGYHNIASVLPAGQIPTRPKNSKTKYITKAKTALKYFGFTEFYTNSATAKENIGKIKLNPEDYITIKNPLVEDFLVMRPHLLATMLPAISENLARFPELQVFEMSRVYVPVKKGLPDEKLMLQLVSTNSDLLVLKGIVEATAKEFGIVDLVFEPETESDRYMSGTSAAISHQKTPIGHIGILAQDIGQAFGITKPLSVAKLHVDYLIEHASDVVTFKTVPKYPALVEDLTFVISADEPVGPLLSKLKYADALVTRVELLDTYTGKNIGKDKKSVTVRVTYQSPTKLLSEKDILPLKQKLHELI